MRARAARPPGSARTPAGRPWSSPRRPGGAPDRRTWSGEHAFRRVLPARLFGPSSLPVWHRPAPRGTAGAPHPCEVHDVITRAPDERTPANTGELRQTHRRQCRSCGPGDRYRFEYDYWKGCGICVSECHCGAIVRNRTGLTKRARHKVTADGSTGSIACTSGRSRTGKSRCARSSAIATGPRARLPRAPR